MLRKGTPADLESMYRLDCVCFEPVFRFSRTAIRRFATADGAFTLVAERDGDLAGFIIVQIDPPGTEAHVVTLDVDPQLRRQGIAQALMLKAEQQAGIAGAHSMALHVWSGNQPARAFYQGLGYSGVQLHPDFYAPGMDAEGMHKLLPSLP